MGFEKAMEKTEMADKDEWKAYMFSILLNRFGPGRANSLVPPAGCRYYRDEPHRAFFERISLPQLP
jgi:hypothetical protein